jgi:hypothetical protein
MFLHRCEQALALNLEMPKAEAAEDSGTEAKQFKVR